jgi:2-keto-4-pentenoate hydratase/2-oxohepta-3-ene-1,7-dioic acid hydratase in catechol pathway
VRLRKVQLRDEGDFSLAVWDRDQWIPIVPALALYRERQGADLPVLASVACDTLTFCRDLEDIRGDVKLLLDFARDQEFNLQESYSPRDTLPFTPLSFRDFMIYERHAIDAARGMVQRFMPAAWRLVRLYETIVRKPPAVLRPKSIWYRQPIYYMGSHINFFANGEELPWPSYTEALDYELELGLVICRPLYNATPEEALRAIGGFVVINDVSARDVQYPEMTSGFGPVKAKNFANAMSSELVTADEILPVVDALEATVSINGRPCGESSTAGMQHSIGEMIAHASLGERILPGELLATGTLPGCSGMETGHWLAAGDELELTINGIGTLSNRIGSPTGVE